MFQYKRMKKGEWLDMKAEAQSKTTHTFCRSISVLNWNIGFPKSMNFPLATHKFRTLCVGISFFLFCFLILFNCKSFVSMKKEKTATLGGWKLIYFFRLFACSNDKDLKCCWGERIWKLCWMGKSSFFSLSICFSFFFRCLFLGRSFEELSL